MLVTEAFDDGLTKTRPHRSEPVENGAADLLSHPADFPSRHIGPSPEETGEMLALLGQPNLEALIDKAVPAGIRLGKPLQIPSGRSEYEVLAGLREVAGQNQVFRSYIGMGYYDCITPAVI